MRTMSSAGELGDTSETVLRQQLAALLRCGAPPDGRPTRATGIHWAGHGWDMPDWGALHRVAQAERIEPLLYVALLAAGCLGKLPPPLAAQLEAAHWRTQIANLLARDAAVQLGEALAAVGVQMVLLKGAALAFGLYRDLACRPLGDIDVLVAPADVAKTLRVMGVLGYAPAGPLRGVPAGDGPGSGSKGGWRSELVLMREGRLRTQVDLHWGLSSRAQLRRGMELAWFWRHTELLPAVQCARGRAQRPQASCGLDGGFAVRIFDAEAQLLHLCAHCLQHGAPRLRWTYDIALLLARRTVDWDLVLDAAVRFRLGLALQETLAAVQVLWGVAPPAGVQARLDALPIGSSERRTWRLTCSGNQQALCAWDIVSLGSVRDFLEASLAAALPPRAHMCRRYGVHDERLLPGLYLYRAVRSSVRGGWGLLRRWRK